MKKMTKKNRKLELTAEMLRALDAAELRQVVGGFSDQNGAGTTCFPVACNIDSDPCQ